MKCRVCRQRAVIQVKRHHANFCKDHFIEHIHRQVAKTIDEYKMFDAADRLLLGVSGGKDSLALWNILNELGYAVDGVYLHLGIGDYSSESLNLSTNFAEARGLKLQVSDLPAEFGFSVPEAAAASRRAPCSACGLSKRYILNQIADELSYDVLVMGHNLDDEAATLFSNVLRWNAEYLARQRPVLPATNEGFARKVKPLIRVAERETAAYAVLQGIDYEVDECPMAAGNTINRYKEWLNRLEEDSPGVKAGFLFGFLERGVEHFPNADRPTLDSCRFCGQPTTSDVCAFCRLQAVTLRA
ncbi:MAG: adenine nucleotide alpha hydrolase family protein [Acidimicrobiia bacterium]|nr:adenine nucleotide alpha hydrolase family protein [Acidimicrobiia bacterium]